MADSSPDIGRRPTTRMRLRDITDTIAMTIAGVTATETVTVTTTETVTVTGITIADGNMAPGFAGSRSYASRWPDAHVLQKSWVATAGSQDTSNG